MKIYTRKGDSGTTQLIGGTRVSKHHNRIEAYGTVDELNSWIGLIRDRINDTHYRALLKEIQDRLFTAASMLATDADKSKMKVPGLNETDIDLLEQEMDAMDSLLPELKSFILPGGNETSSKCHIARCVCRRAERHVVMLHETESVDPLILKYLNRLSDYLFVLARKISFDHHSEETIWQPRIKP